MTVKTLDQGARSEQGSLAGERRNVVRAILDVLETRGLEVGPDEYHLIPFKQQAPDVYGAPPPLITGEVAIVLPGSHRLDASVVFRQSDPLPVTVLALTTWVSIG